MFAVGDHIPLSTLWRSFEEQFLPLCTSVALGCLRSEKFDTPYMFGNALDLCEDAFLRSFDNFQISLVSLRGDVVRVDPMLKQTGARMFQKATAFESTHISQRPNEAGPDKQWLTQMGSSRFRPAEVDWLWPPIREDRGTDEELTAAVGAKVFHTLPIFFERPTFIVAKERPPWSYGLLEDAYFQELWAETRGYSICVDRAVETAWLKEQTRKTVEACLKSLLRNAPARLFAKTENISGRPRKVDEVRKAYLELGLSQKSLPAKVELQEIERLLDIRVSRSTLSRAKRSR